MNPFLIFWRAGRDLFDELFLMIGVNVIWAVMSCPLIVVAVFFFGNSLPIVAAIALILNVLLMGPASAGLLAVAERVIEGRVAPLSLFFEGLRAHYVLSWQVYGIWMFGFVTLLFNVAFYFQVGGWLGTFLIVIFVYLTATWSMLLIYLGPLMVLQEQRGLWLMWRNALIMTFGRPLFTIATAILMALIIVLSIFVVILPLILTFSMLTLWSMRATLAQIASEEERRLRREQGDVIAETPTAERGRSGQVRSRK